MRMRTLGRLWPVSALALGGGGIGQLWGSTSREEAVATLHATVAAGINLLDMAPAYGDGEAERAIGEAFGGRLPDGVRVTTKCRIGRDAPPDRLAETLRRSLEQSLANMRLSRVDLFFLHSNIAPEGHSMLQGNEAAIRIIPWSTYRDWVVPALEGLVAEGLAGAWGITGIGHPDAIIEALGHARPPAAVQCIANLLDSPGSLKFYPDPSRPREIIAAAGANGIGVLGIRAVQAGALTDAIDRPLPDDHAEMRDYRRTAPFRALARETGESAATLAHRYALSMPGIDSVVLGVKNWQELQQCIAAEERGPLEPALIARIDACVES